MRAKEYLSQLYDLREKKKRAERELKEIRGSAGSIRPMRFDQVRVQSSSDPDPMISYITALEKAEERALRESTEYHRLYDQIKAEIYSIDEPLYRGMLAHKYLDGMNTTQVARKMHYAKEYIENRYGDAYRAFENQILEFK